MKNEHNELKRQILKPEVKNKWIVALRSGDYKQGRNTLRNPQTDEYCCLGVLCELAHKENICTKEEREYNTMFGGHDGLPPLTVRQWAGLSDKSFDSLFIIENDSLAFLNDVRKLSFNEIADLIENNL